MKPDVFESALDDLDVRLERLFALYEQFLGGDLKLDPIALQKDIGRRIVRLQAEPSPSDAANARLRGILDRFENLQRYWERLSERMKSGAHQRVPPGPPDPRALGRSDSSGGWDMSKLEAPIHESTLRGYTMERPPMARNPVHMPEPREGANSVRTPPLGTPAVHGPWADSPVARPALSEPPSLHPEPPHSRYELESLPEFLPTSIRPPPLPPTSPLPPAPAIPRDSAKTIRDLGPFHAGDSAATTPDVFGHVEGDSATTVQDLPAHRADASLSSAETRRMEEPTSSAETRRIEEPASSASDATTRRIEERQSRIDTVPAQHAIASLLASDDLDDRAPTLRVERPEGPKHQANEASGTLSLAGRTFAVDPRDEEPTPVGPRFAELQARARSDPAGNDRTGSPLVPLERVREIQAELRAKNGRKKPVSLERLAEMLEQAAARLKAQYGDRTITFEVVMKDGKAVIKPIVR